MTNITPLLSELLRPKTLSELNLPATTIASLQRMAENGSVMNLLFHGGPGIGKTSAARILVKLMDADVFEINAAETTSDKAMKNQIEDFCRSVSLLGGPKVCLIDEAEFLGSGTQALLRNLIEASSQRVRFLMTANDISKFSAPLLSRCHPICFDVPRSETGEVVERMTARYSTIFTEMGFSVSRAKVGQIVATFFPDLRCIANQFQMELG